MAALVTAAGVSVEEQEKMDAKESEADSTSSKPIRGSSGDSGDVGVVSGAGCGSGNGGWGTHNGFRSGDSVSVLFNTDATGRGVWSACDIIEMKSELSGRSVRQLYRVRDHDDGNATTWIGDGAGREGKTDAVMVYPWQHAAIRVLTKLPARRQDAIERQASGGNVSAGAPPSGTLAPSSTSTGAAEPKDIRELAIAQQARVDAQNAAEEMAKAAEAAVARQKDAEAAARTAEARQKDAEAAVQAAIARRKATELPVPPWQHAEYQRTVGSIQELDATYQTVQAQFRASLSDLQMRLNVAQQAMRGDVVFALQGQFRELQHAFMTKQSMLRACAQECRAFVARYEQSFAARMQANQTQGAEGGALLEESAASTDPAQPEPATSVVPPAMMQASPAPPASSLQTASSSSSPPQAGVPSPSPSGACDSGDPVLEIMNEVANFLGMPGSAERHGACASTLEQMDASHPGEVASLLPLQLSSSQSSVAVTVSLRQSGSASLEPPADEVTPQLMRRLLAFRQAIEYKRCLLGTKATNKPWKISVRRTSAALHGGQGAGAIDHADAIRAFRVPFDDPKRKRALLHCNTVVSFVDPFGEVEDGEDLGGLTTEMYSNFWLAVLAPKAALFETCDGEPLEGGGTSSAASGFLPLPTACEEQLEALGLVLCKCIIDDHPIGHGLCGFVIDYLVNGYESEALSDPSTAVRALHGFDRALADRWRALLDEPSCVVRRGHGAWLRRF